MTTNNAVNVGLSGSTGTGSFVGSTSPTLVTPALGTPSTINLSNATSLTSSALPSGTLFNFQSASLTTPVTTTSSTMATATGLSVTITPTSSSNNILVRAVVQFGCNIAVTTGIFQLARGSTAIGVGTSVGSRLAVGSEGESNSAVNMQTTVLEWVDNPATTSATTYNLQFASKVNANTVAINSSTTDTNSNTFTRGASIITVCEIHA